MSRLTRLTPELLTAEQKQTYDALTNGPRGANMIQSDGSLGGPFNSMLHSPNIGIALQELGARLRYGTSIPRPLLELAIITIGAHWQAQYEFWAHARMALEAGIKQEVVTAIQLGEEPDLDDSEALVYEFCIQMIETKRIREDTYQKLVETLGEAGIMEIASLIGYYSAISIILNTFEISVPENATAPFKKT
jgi:4-carboxymuconolactone decarboxylase